MFGDPRTVIQRSGNGRAVKIENSGNIVDGYSIRIHGLRIQLSMLKVILKNIFTYKQNSIYSPQLRIWGSSIEIISEL